MKQLGCREDMAMKTSFEIDGSGYTQALDDWTQTEQKRERVAQWVIGAVSAALLLGGSFLLSRML
jgi:hypothetical protein